MSEAAFDLERNLGAHRAVNVATQPELALILAVLDDGVRTFLRRGDRPSARRLREEAAAWIASDDVEWPYAFRNLCDALGLDVAAVRVALAKRVAGNDAGPLPKRRARAYAGSGHGKVRNRAELGPGRSGGRRTAFCSLYVPSARAAAEIRD